MNTSVYTDLFSLIHAASFSMSGNLVTYSIKLLGILATIVIVWEGIKAAIGGSVQDFLATIFTLLITLSLLLPILMNWTSGMSLPLAVTAMVSELAMLLGGSASAVTAGMLHINSAISELAKVPFTMKEAGGAGGFYDKFDFTLVIDAIMMGPNILLVGVAQLLLGIMAALMIGIQLIGDIMLAVATIVGPFLLAWSILPITRSLRDGLVKFVFNAIMLKLVGIILASLVGAAARTFVANKLVNGGEPNTVAIVVLIGLIVMLIYVLFQAQTLASALISGGSLDTPGGALKRAAASSMMPGRSGGKK